MKHLLLALSAVMLLTCYGCNQSTTENVIQDGSEAATVAAVIALDTALPQYATQITNGLQKASAEAVSLLSFPTDMFTLDQLIKLDMAKGDPYLDKYQAIINFALPILNDIPGIDTAMNTPLNALSKNVLNDVKAFFTGIQLGLGQPAGTTVKDLMDRNPRLRKAVRKYGTSRFDINGLINNLKDSVKPVEAKK